MGAAPPIRSLHPWPKKGTNTAAARQGAFQLNPPVACTVKDTNNQDTTRLPPAPPQKRHHGRQRGPAPDKQGRKNETGQTEETRKTPATAGLDLQTKAGQSKAKKSKRRQSKAKQSRTKQGKTRGQAEAGQSKRASIN